MDEHCPSSKWYFVSAVAQDQISSMMQLGDKIYHPR
jgi:hypothetical protein